MKRAGSVFCVIVGLCMLGIWSVLLLAGQVKEIGTEPFRIAAHLISEGMTAVLLILGGLLSIREHVLGKKLRLVSLGMLLYSVLVAGGYYLQLKDAAMTVMFGILFTAAALFTAFDVADKDR